METMKWMILRLLVRFNVIVLAPVRTQSAQTARRGQIKR